MAPGDAVTLGQHLQRERSTGDQLVKPHAPARECLDQRRIASRAVVQLIQSGQCQLGLDTTLLKDDGCRATRPVHGTSRDEWWPRSSGTPAQICPRVGFIVNNLARLAERVVAFYNHRGTCEQYIKEGKGAIKWIRLSCRSFAANAVRLQLHVLAYNLGNFMRTLAMTKTAELWSLTSLDAQLMKYA